MYVDNRVLKVQRFNLLAIAQLHIAVLQHLCTVCTTTIVKSMVCVYMITLHDHEDLFSKHYSTVAAILIVYICYECMRTCGVHTYKLGSIHDQGSS